MNMRIVIQNLRRFAIVGAASWTSVVYAVVLNGPVSPSPKQFESIEASTMLFQGVAGGICTATVVGNRALLTAAHCISVSATVSAQLDGKKYVMRCTRVAGQNQRRFDVALCVSDQELEGVRAALIDTSHSISLGESLLMAGYGCTHAGGLDRSGIGQLTVGSARVTEIDATLKSAPHEAPFVVTTGSSPCFGDAGGGVYRTRDATQSSPVVVGLISRGDLSTTSYIVPFSATGLAEALRQAGNEKGASICGVHDSGTSCASGIGMRPAEKANRSVQLRSLGEANVSQTSIVGSQVVRAAGNGEESVAQAFHRVCGISIDAIPGITQAQVNAAKTVTAANGSVLELPPCPPKLVVKTMTKTIKPGDTVWSIWKDLRNSTPSAAKTSPGKNEFRLYSRQFELANGGIDLKPDVVVNVPPIKRNNHSIQAPIVPVVAAPQATPILTLSSTEAEQDCKSASSAAEAPYNLQLLLEILTLNRHEDLAQPTPVIVLVADSGLQGAGEGIFSDSVLLSRPGEDRSEFNKSILPLVLDPSAFKHGTAVASVALGGPVFAGMGVIQTSPRIQLAIQRIYYTPKGNTEAVGGVTADVSRFDDLISLAEDQNAAVVNLSLRSTVRIPAIEVNLADSKGRILFVAAAGNQRNKLNPNPASDTEAAYPALYGGSARERLITVMALGPDGARPKFSNWGAPYVDIAAPGCNIPTLEWHDGVGRFVSTTASGTSLAAPQVTFAAALVQSESGNRLRARDVKRRLLVSADVSPTETLLKEVQDGRKLNVAKAAAWRVDVLDLMDGPLLAGKVNFVEDQRVLTDEDILQFNCQEEQDLRIRRRDLFKIARWMPQQGLKRYLVYYRSSAANLFARDTCEEPTDFKLELRKPNDQVKKIGWDQVKDLVMRF